MSGYNNEEFRIECDEAGVGFRFAKILATAGTEDTDSFSTLDLNSGVAGGSETLFLLWFTSLGSSLLFEDNGDSVWCTSEKRRFSFFGRAL